MRGSHSLRPCLALMIGCASVPFAACGPLSEKEVDAAAGLNGSFEVARNGLPVNWLMYTPNTVRDADFQIVMDREVFQDGRQSLKFDVVRCDSRGGSRSPGFTNEFFDVGRFRGPETYRVSFWIRNSGAEYMFVAGPVSAKTGDMRVLRRDDSVVSDWTQYGFTIQVPNEQWLRMQLNVLSPGTLWIDDVRIEPVG